MQAWPQRDDVTLERAALAAQCERVEENIGCMTSDIAELRTRLSRLEQAHAEARVTFDVLVGLYEARYGTYQPGTPGKEHED